MPHLSNNRSICEHTHSFIRKQKQTFTVDSQTLITTGYNPVMVENCLIISLAKSYEERLKPLLIINPFRGKTTVIEAVDGNELPKVAEGIPLRQGDLGCLLSHIKALEYAQKQGWKCVLIFEDDITFVDGFNDKLKTAMKSLPSRWDMLWIGGTDAKPSYPYNDYLKRLNQSWGTYGYVIRDCCYQYFIDLFNEQKRSSDDYYRANHAKFSSFRTKENLVIHKNGTSDRLKINHINK